MFLAGIRGFAAGLFMSVYLYTPEVRSCDVRMTSHDVITILLQQVYPTAIRAFGMSLCSAMSRFGGMTAPFIAQV